MIILIVSNLLLVFVALILSAALRLERTYSAETAAGLERLRGKIAETVTRVNRQRSQDRKPVHPAEMLAHLKQNPGKSVRQAEADIHGC